MSNYVLRYGWLNDLKGIAAAFLDSPGTQPYIKRFIPTMVVLAFAFSLTLLWFPVATSILVLMGAHPRLIEACRTPFHIFSVFCFAVGTRNYFTALCIAAKRTWPLMFSGPVRLSMLFAVGFSLKAAGVEWAAFLVLPPCFRGLLPKPRQLLCRIIVAGEKVGTHKSRI